MLPILFSFKGYHFYTFGFLLTIGYLLAAFMIWRRLKELGFKEEKVLDLILVSGVVSLIFARFWMFPLKWFDLANYPGLSYFGAIFGFFLTVYWFCKQQKWDFWQVADDIIFGFLPLLIITQIGSFFDGSGQGGPTTMPWGIFFPGSLVRRHPLAIFVAIILLIIWLILLNLERLWRFWEWYKSKAAGFLTLVFMTLFFISNILLAFFKGDALYLRLMEVIGSLVGLLISSVIFYIRSGRKILNGKKTK